MLCGFIAGNGFVDAGRVGGLVSAAGLRGCQESRGALFVLICDQINHGVLSTGFVAEAGQGVLLRSFRVFAAGHRAARLEQTENVRFSS